MDVVFSKAAARALLKSGKRTLIAAKIEELAADPSALAGNVKRLKGREESRLRVQDWRIIFRFEGDVLHILEIEPRGSAYGD